MAPVPIIYVARHSRGDRYFASRKGARQYLEHSFQEHWARAHDPADHQYDFVWAQRYRELSEREARNSFMKANIWYLNVQA